MPNKISEIGLSLERHYESLHDGDLSMIGLQPKMDPSRIWTEGYGHAMVYQGKFLKGAENEILAYNLSRIHNEVQANTYLITDNQPFENRVGAILTRLEQHQFDALISFSYNLGFGNLLTSTLLKRIRANASNDAITEAFCRFNMSDGKVLPGLTFRRQSEAHLFATGELKFFNIAA